MRLRALQFAFCAACGGGASLVGVSEPKAPSLNGDAGEEEVATFGRLDGFEQVAPFRRSRGHFLGGVDVEILANGVAARALDETVFPASSRFLALHRQDAGTLQIYSATKESGDAGVLWRFDVDGKRGPDLCVGCHREAARDFVFTRKGHADGGG